MSFGELWWGTFKVETKYKKGDNLDYLYLCLLFRCRPPGFENVLYKHRLHRINPHWNLQMAGEAKCTLK